MRDAPDPAAPAYFPHQQMQRDVWIKQHLDRIAANKAASTHELRDCLEEAIASDRRIRRSLVWLAAMNAAALLFNGAMIFLRVA